MKCIRIAPRTAPVVVEIENELPALQAAVGGYIEVATISPEVGEGVVGIVDEEGKMHHQQFNRAATNLVEARHYGDYIVGTMLIVGCDGDGEFIDVPADVVEYVKRMAS